MPTITLNKTILEKLTGKKLPLEQLKDRISMLGTDLEKIEGNKIVVEIFPNRPDLLSEQGFARALSSFIGVKTGLRKYTVKRSGEKVIIDSSVKKVRPYTACAIVKNMRFDEENAKKSKISCAPETSYVSERINEIIQMQEKLHITYGRNRKKLAIGIYPMEKIKFPITYKAEKPENIVFQPLESKQRMTGLQILSQHKAGREFGHLLEGLDRFPVFRDAKGEVLSMPPVINSHLTGRVTEQTKDIFVECSGFDLNVLKKCLNIVVTALAEMGGEIYSLEMDFGARRETTPDLSPEKMKLDLDYINQRLGLNLKETEAKKLLEKMGYGYEKGTVLVPAYRTDILHQVDLMEDIAIAYGYENFEEIIPKVATIAEEDPQEGYYRKIRDILIGLGLLEVKNYHLMKKEELTINMNQDNKPIPLKNSLGDYNHLRDAILPSLMKNLSENQHNEYSQNIFEIGRAFFEDKDEDTGVGEKECLAITLCHEKADFTQIKQVLDALMRSLGKEYAVKESRHPSFIPGRAGEITIAGKKIGVIGELAPHVLAEWGLMVPVVGLELEVTNKR